jgi:hypothetical protein
MRRRHERASAWPRHRHKGRARIETLSTSEGEGKPKRDLKMPVQESKRGHKVDALNKIAEFSHGWAPKNPARKNRDGFNTSFSKENLEKRMVMHEDNNDEKQNTKPRVPQHVR